MQRSQIRLKQLLIFGAFLLLSSLSLQGNAKTNSDSQLQQVVSTSNQQPIKSLQTSDQQPSKSSTTKTTNPKTQTTRSSSSDNLPFILLAVAIIGLAILLFIPGRYIRKPIVVDLDQNQQPSNDNDSATTVDTVDIYQDEMEAIDEIEHQLDIEESLDNIDPNIQGRIGSRDRKHTNRVTNRRKK